MNNDQQQSCFQKEIKKLYKSLLKDLFIYFLFNINNIRKFYRRKRLRLEI